MREVQIPMADALFYSFNMYFVAYKGPIYNYFVEAVRWLAPIMTFRSVLMFFNIIVNVFIIDIKNLIAQFRLINVGGNHEKNINYHFLLVSF